MKIAEYQELIKGKEIKLPDFFDISPKITLSGYVWNGKYFGLCKTISSIRVEVEMSKPITHEDLIFTDEDLAKINRSRLLMMKWNNGEIDIDELIKEKENEEKTSSRTNGTNGLDSQIDSDLGDQIQD